MATRYRSVSPGNIAAPKNPLPLQAETIMAQMAMSDCSKLLHCVISILGMPPRGEVNFVSEARLEQKVLPERLRMLGMQRNGATAEFGQRPSRQQALFHFCA